MSQANVANTSALLSQIPMFVLSPAPASRETLRYSPKIALNSWNLNININLSIINDHKPWWFTSWDNSTFWSLEAETCWDMLRHAEPRRNSSSEVVSGGLDKHGDETTKPSTKRRRHDVTAAGGAAGNGPPRRPRRCRCRSPRNEKHETKNTSNYEILFKFHSESVQISNLLSCCGNHRPISALTSSRAWRNLFFCHQAGTGPHPLKSQ